VCLRSSPNPQPKIWAQRLRGRPPAFARPHRLPVARHRRVPLCGQNRAQAGKGLTPRNHRSATVQAFRQGLGAVVWGIFRLRKRVRAFTHSSAPRRRSPSAFRPGRARARPSTLSRPACQATNDANPAGNWTGFSLPHLCKPRHTPAPSTTIPGTTHRKPCRPSPGRKLD